jgi:hypothetical protein
MDIKHADDGSFTFRIKKKELVEARNPKAWVADIIEQEGFDPDKCTISSTWSYNRAVLIFTVRPHGDSEGSV